LAIYQILPMRKIFAKVFYGALFFFLLALFLNSEIKISKSPSQGPSEKWGAGIIRNEEKSSLSDEELSPEVIFEGTEDDIIALVNMEREKQGLAVLAKNEKLMQSAFQKALDMKNNHYFDHVSPDGVQPWFFAEKVGYKYSTMGENLAEGFFSAQSVHQAWMNSPGHRENILSENFEEIGVAIVDFEENGLKSYLIVQHFGSQIKPEELEKVTQKPICDERIVQQCENLEEKDDDLEEAIEEYEKILKKAKKAGASKKDIKKIEDYLEEIKDIEDEVDAYLNDCKRYFEKCEK